MSAEIVSRSLFSFISVACHEIRAPLNKPNQPVRTVSTDALGEALKDTRLTCLYKLAADAAIFHTRVASDKFTASFLSPTLLSPPSSSLQLVFIEKTFAPTLRSFYLSLYVQGYSNWAKLQLPSRTTLIRHLLLTVIHPTTRKINFHLFLYWYLPYCKFEQSSLRRYTIFAWLIVSEEWNGRFFKVWKELKS